MKRYLLTVLMVLMVAVLPGRGAERAGRCGVERWAVKTLTDTAASQVNLSPRSATVEQLAVLRVPAGFGPSVRRLAPEDRTYTLTATLVEFKQEADSDVHLVLRGQTGRTMIAEIPAPACARGSRVLAQITAVRAFFVKRYGQPSSAHWMHVGRPVVVTGVLFFDVLHGQTGVASNGVELHPVLGLR